MRISDWSSDVCSSDLAGIPARLLRVGFVGELGYEIHVPASQGEALWDALLEAGQPEGIRPFGVEAQRVLRQIGRASCRERVCQYVLISVIGVYLTRKKQLTTTNR